LGVAALIAWLMTAAFGGALVYLWASRATRSSRPSSYGRPPPYIPRWLVALHVLLAVAGLATWVGALVYLDELAYSSIVILLAVALLGASMFVRWLGSRRARRAARAARALGGAPAESRLPTLVVLSHGALGLTTVALVLLSYFHPRHF
jgi:hypothetical protein